MQLRRGSLSETDFIEILKDAAASNLTGMIRLENGPIIKVVYFQNGTIAFASSNEKADRLTEVLKRAGKLTPEQVEDAQSRLKPNISLGKTLVELGYISARDLLWGARAQVEGILYQLLFLREGIFQVMEGSLPKEIIVLNLSVPGVIFDGICKSQDREWVLGRIGSPESIYKLAPDFHEKYIPHKLRMMRADDVVSRMDGKRSLEKIAHLAGLDTFEACKMTAALELLSLIEKAPEVHRQEIPQLPVEETRKREGSEEAVELADEQEAVPVGAPAGKPKQLVLEPANVSLGQMMQIPSVAELRPSSPSPSEENALATNTVEEGPFELEPQEPEAAAIASATIDDAGLEPVSLAEPEPPSESAFITAARAEEAPSNSHAPLLITILVIVALGASAYYYYTSHPAVAQLQQPPVQKPKVAAPMKKSEVKPASPVIAPTEKPPAELTQPPAATPQPEPATPVATAAPKPESSPSEAGKNGLALIQQGKLSEAASQWQNSLSTDRAKFAVQLAIACQPDTVTDAVSRFEDKSKFYILPLQFKGQPCYRILVGNFEDSATAESARLDLPPEFLQQPSPPQVVPVVRLLKLPQ